MKVCTNKVNKQASSGRGGGVDQIYFKASSGVVGFGQVCASAASEQQGQELFVIGARKRHCHAVSKLGRGVSYCTRWAGCGEALQFQDQVAGSKLLVGAAPPSPCRGSTPGGLGRPKETVKGSSDVEERLLVHRFDDWAAGVHLALRILHSGAEQGDGPPAQQAAWHTGHAEPSLECS